MKKRKVIISNRVIYTLIAFALLVGLGVGVFAYGGSSPSTMGHSAGELNLSGGVNEIAIFNNKVGIGTASPLSKLSVNGVGFTTVSMYVRSDNSPTSFIAVYGDGGIAGVYGKGVVNGVKGVGETGVYGEGTTTGVHGYGTTTGVYGAGNTYDFYATGDGTNYGAASSMRWKNNITKINNALNKILDLRGVYFNWNQKNNTRHDMGFIAEEVGKIVPEIVEYETDLSNPLNYYIDANGNKKLYATGIDYGALTPVLVEAIKDQQSIILQQNNTINQMRKSLCNLGAKEWC